MPLYSNLKNPYFVDIGESSIKLGQKAREYAEKKGKWHEVVNKDLDARTWYLKELGYDGLIDDKNIKNAHEIVVFNNKQIKY